MRSKRTRQRYGILIIPIIFIGFFLIGSLAGQYFNPNFGPASGGLFKKKPSDKIILLYGVDARNKNESSRSDTMILAFIHPQINRIDLLSVPRDSRVSIPGEDHDRKINYANVKGGSDLLIETIEGLLKINIDGYIQVDFEGFEDLIDTMGGVDLSVEKRMYYPAEDIDLMAGKQHLDGHDALAYVRYRSDGMGDIGRIQRQQKFMRAFIRQAAGAEAIIKSPVIASKVFKIVNTNLSVNDLTDLARYYSQQPLVNSYMLPGESRMINGGSYWVIDWDQADAMMAEIKNTDVKINNEGNN